MRASKANDHQARRLQRSYGHNQRSAQNQRDKSRRSCQEEQRNLDIRDDALRCRRAQPVQEQRHTGTEYRESDSLIGQIRYGETAPESTEISGSTQKEQTQ